MYCPQMCSKQANQGQLRILAIRIFIFFTSEYASKAENVTVCWNLIKEMNTFSIEVCYWLEANYLRGRLIQGHKY